MQTIRMGNLRIDHVEETCFVEAPPHDLLADLPPDAVDRHLDWMVPRFMDAHERKIISSVHSWLIRTGRHTILIDTCCGNDKDRPAFPFISHLQLPFLDRLGAHGVSPKDVDFVFCTHLHLDHVGWNTRLLDGRWVPTFPNAKYIWGRREYEYWFSSKLQRDVDPTTAAVFADSVQPVVEARQMVLVEDGYTLDDMLAVELADGHSEGHVLIRATSGGASGLFIGDIMHTPLQIPYPDSNSIYCQFPERARATRRRVLEDCAENGHLLLPAHFPTPHVGRIAADNASFRFLFDL